MPAGSVFVDTNVLLYSLDARNPDKRARATEWLDHLWATGTGRLSWQVLNEFYVNAVAKISVPPLQAREVVTLLSQWKPVAVTMHTIERGWYWMDRAKVPYWDSLILASAERLGCEFLLSEGFQSGRQYEGIKIVHPFTTPVK